MEKRSAQIRRTTGETDIFMDLCIDGSGKAELSTGIGFFDHMMDAFTRHGLFDLKLEVKGDLNVDGHHSVEDTERPWATRRGSKGTDISSCLWMRR